MLGILKNAIGGVKRYMDKKIAACARFLSLRENRMIAGIVIMGASLGFVGIGGALFASAYIKVPKD